MLKIPHCVHAYVETKFSCLLSGLKRHLATHLNSLPNANQPQQQHQPTTNEIVSHTQPTGSVPIQTVSEEHKFNNHISLPTTPLPSVSLPLHLTQPQQQQQQQPNQHLNQMPHLEPLQLQEQHHDAHQYDPNTLTYRTLKFT